MRLESEMRSLILRDWEVCGILDGRLTQLRRVVKPQPMCEEVPENIGNDRWCGRYRVLGMDGEEVVRWDEFGPCPLGVPGETRWVRETWAPHCLTLETAWYRADAEDCHPSSTEWRSAATMPRWASRITVEIVRTWVERVQDGDVDVEQWDLDNPRNPWSANPWTWAAEIRNVES